MSGMKPQVYSQSYNLQLTHIQQDLRDPLYTGILCSPWLFETLLCKQIIFGLSAAVNYNDDSFCRVLASI